MATSPEFAAHLQDLFAGLGAVEIKRMFGGVGVFYGGVMVGLVADDVLFLKVDEDTQARFAAEGMAPFTYTMKGKPMEMSYFQAPPDAMEDASEFTPWARVAYEAALRADAKKPPKQRKAKQG